MKTIINIGCLTGVDSDKPLRLRGDRMNTVGMIEDAWLRIDGTDIHSFGSMTEYNPAAGEEVIDAAGEWVFASFCDSHTHIVYAGSREQEFLDKINGLSYEEIARRGGGILNSADRLHETSEDELYQQALARVNELIAKGTGCLEVKSGYGLTLEDELKMLRVIRRLRENTPMTIRATFLGAHAVGRKYAGRQGEYVEHICRDMLPAVAAEGLADFVDVFCDRGFFTVEETDRILTEAAKYGMRPKIHANELDSSGGVQIGVKHNALSVDHLERAEDADVECLAASDTIPTALPGASFFLNMPYAPAKQMIAAGLPVALASDYNPGSSPSGDMRMVMALACIKMRLTPQQAYNALTLNGAAAMGLSDRYGSIACGKVANVFFTKKLPDLAFMPYAYTTPLITRVMLNGEFV